MLEKENSKMIQEITNLVNEVKSNLSSEINKSIIYVYWNIGKIIVSNENEFNNRLEYGKEVLKGAPPFDEENKKIEFIGISLLKN